MALPSSRSWIDPRQRADVQRDHALGAPSARSMLLTILGEFALEQKNPTWTAAFVKALGALDIDEKTARQTLGRSSNRGLLKSEKVGRRTRWYLTDRAQVLLNEGSQRIYSFHTENHQWDGNWIVIFVAIPESRRDARYNLRVKLGWAGFAPLSAGTWICPWTEREHEARIVLSELGLNNVSHTFIGKLSKSESASELAQEAWDLPSVEAVYEEFQTAHRNSDPKTPEEKFVALTRMVNQWRRLPLMDPDLPQALLPKNWSGDRAAKLFHQLRDLWKLEAAQWWNQINEL